MRVHKSPYLLRKLLSFPTASQVGGAVVQVSVHIPDIISTQTSYKDPTITTRKPEPERTPKNITVRCPGSVIKSQSFSLQATATQHSTLSGHLGGFERSVMLITIPSIPMLEVAEPSIWGKKILVRPPAPHGSRQIFVIRQLCVCVCTPCVSNRTGLPCFPLRLVICANCLLTK